jgi:hypothetical protein
MKKPHLSVYLDPAILAQLAQRAARLRQSKSLLAEAAITAFLTPDDADQREAAFARRLDLLSRQALVALMGRCDRSMRLAASEIDIKGRDGGHRRRVSPSDRRAPEWYCASTP